MQSGLIILETSLSHAGLVRLRTTAGPIPEGAFSQGPTADPSIRYAARFDDLDAGRMHAFTALRFRLVDVDKGLFRVPIADALAKVEGLALPHRCVYFDPDLRRESGDFIDRRITSLRRRHGLHDFLWRLVGWIAVAWLFALSIFTL